MFHLPYLNPIPGKTYLFLEFIMGVNGRGIDTLKTKESMMTTVEIQQLREKSN
jgi:hypothetical protein